jgi:hypothetical protein
VTGSFAEYRLLADHVRDIILPPSPRRLDRGDRGLVSPEAPFVAEPFTPEALARRTREVLDAARSWQECDREGSR